MSKTPGAHPNYKGQSYCTNYLPLKVAHCILFSEWKILSTRDSEQAVNLLFTLIKCTPYLTFSQSSMDWQNFCRQIATLTVHHEQAHFFYCQKNNNLKRTIKKGNKLRERLNGIINALNINCYSGVIRYAQPDSWGSLGRQDLLFCAPGFVSSKAVVSIPLRAFWNTSLDWGEGWRLYKDSSQTTWC